MRVAIRITVDVDEAAWRDEYGVSAAGLREDVKNYMYHMVMDSVAAAGALLTVTSWT